MLINKIIVGVAVASTALTSLSFAANWVPITGDELKEIYSDKTYRGETKKGKKFTSNYCADGTGVLIIRGGEKKRTWELKGDDQICVTNSKGSVSCFTWVRNAENPSKIKGTRIDMKVAYELTLQEGKPDICN